MMEEGAAVSRAILTILCLGIAVSASAATPDGRVMCLVEVLHSEELPGAPIFQNHVRATLLVTPPAGAPFETTVEKLIPFQVPPPRKGQRLRLPCDPANLSSPWSFSFPSFF
jgi:hypothetical protein